MQIKWCSDTVASTRSRGRLGGGGGGRGGRMGLCCDRRPPKQSMMSAVCAVKRVYYPFRVFADRHRHWLEGTTLRLPGASSWRGAVYVWTSLVLRRGSQVRPHCHISCFGWPLHFWSPSGWSWGRLSGCRFQLERRHVFQNTNKNMDN